MDSTEASQRILELCRARALQDYANGIDALHRFTDELMAKLNLHNGMNRTDFLNAAAQSGGQNHPAVLKGIESRAKEVFDELVKATLETLEPTKRGPGRPAKIANNG